MKTPQWIFDRAPVSGARKGGLASVHVFEPKLDTFVREVLQNARDQRIGDKIVDVVFTLNRLSGSTKEAFLEAIGWDQLRPRLESAQDTGGITIGPQMATALKVADSDSLLLLTISDYGTQGLTGPEQDDDKEPSNFTALCKHMLVRSEHKSESGGSFGIGKSVLWRFSRFSTVLFASQLHDMGTIQTRFFGRAELPYHRAGGLDWEGQGWFGLPEAVPGTSDQRAVSVWGTRAERMAAETYLERQGVRTGTSILIVGFFEPDQEEDRDDKAIAADLLDSASTWFWPCMFATESPSLRVTVEVQKNGKQVYRGDAEVTPEVAPFVEAVKAEPVSDTHPPGSGDVIERVLNLEVPGKKIPEANDDGMKAVCPVRLRVRIAEKSDSTVRSNSVALVRGAGMVVKYMQGNDLLSDRHVHGVLLAGTANGNSDFDHKLEAFLRAAEPPSHNDWVHSTDRVRTEYKRGARANLSRLWSSINSEIRGLFFESAQTQVIGAPALSKLLPLPGGRGGGTATTERFTVNNLQASFSENVWAFSGKARMRRATQSGWKFWFEPRLDAETGNGTLLELAELMVDDGMEVKSEDGRLVCYVPKGIGQVEFVGQTVPVNSGQHELDAMQTGFRLTVRNGLA